MTVKELVERGNFQPVFETNGERRVTGVYTGDLLSWVMSHAAGGEAWITVQGHSNIVAIGALLELSCIIIAEDAPLDDETISKAVQEGIPILKSPHSAYQICRFFADSGL